MQTVDWLMILSLVVRGCFHYGRGIAIPMVVRGCFHYGRGIAIPSEYSLIMKGRAIKQPSVEEQVVMNRDGGGLCSFANLCTHDVLGGELESFFAYA